MRTGSVSPALQEIIFQPRSLFPSGFPARRVASPPPAPEKRSTLRLSPALSFPRPLPDSSAIGKEGTCESPQLGTQRGLPWEWTMFVQKRSAHSVDRVQTPPVPGTSPQRGLEFSLSLFFQSVIYRAFRKRNGELPVCIFLTPTLGQQKKSSHRCN